MRALKPTFFCIAVLLLAPGSALYARTPPPSVYLTATSLPPELLPPPPAEGSSEWKQNIEAVLEAQQHLLPADLSATRDDQKVRIEILTSALGSDFTASRLPTTFHLLENVFNDTLGVTDVAKDYWHMRRSYLADRRVDLKIDPLHNSPSYPSGHTSSSRVLAEVLGLLLPEKRSVLRARADAIARHRLEAGMHYPSDLEGGRLLAMLIVGALTQDQKFQEDLTAARQELARVKN